MSRTYKDKTVRTHHFPTWLKRCLNSRERAYSREFCYLSRAQFQEPESFRTKHLWRME